VNIRDTLRDLVGRVALVREALIDGDTEFAADLLRDLELDVATVLERVERNTDLA
jgi:hypothetical protein